MNNQVKQPMSKRLGTLMQRIEVGGGVLALGVALWLLVFKPMLEN